MKKIEAIIKEESLDRVKDALEAAGFIGMTIFNVKGRGAQGGLNLQWRAGTYKVDFLHKIMLMLVVRDEDYERAVDVIVKNCQSDLTGGAGKIFVSSVDEIIRIRTGEKNEDALG